jgi:hypothetical protein
MCTSFSRTLGVGGTKVGGLDVAAFQFSIDQMLNHAADTRAWRGFFNEVHKAVVVFDAD